LHSVCPREPYYTIEPTTIYSVGLSTAPTRPANSPSAVSAANAIRMESSLSPRRLAVALPGRRSGGLRLVRLRGRLVGLLGRLVGLRLLVGRLLLGGGRRRQP